MNKCGKYINFVKILASIDMKKIILLSAVLAAATATAQVNSPTATGCLESGRQMLEAGNCQGCLDRVNTADVSTMSASQLEEAAWLRAVATYRGGFPGAKASLEDFINAYPASDHRVEALIYLANTLLESSPARALEIYGELNPGGNLEADVCYHRAYALMRLGEFDRAEAAFSKTVNDDVYGADSRFYLGYIAYTKRDFGKAVPMLQRASRRSLPGAAADYYLAQIYYMQGENDKALNAARALIGSRVVDNPSFIAEAYRIAGEALQASGDTREAIPYLEKYVSMTDSPEPSALYILGTALYNKGDWSAAVRYLEPVTAGDNAMAQSAYLYIGEALMKLDDKVAAMLAFDKALRMDYDSDVREAAFYNYAVAKAAGASTPFGSSAAIFEEFLRNYPDGPYTADVQEYIVTGYLTDHNYEAALESIERMSRPADKVLAAKQQILYALGTRALSTDNVTAARDYLTRGIELSRFNQDVAASTHLSLGEALYRMGENKAAAVQFEQYLAMAQRGDINRPLALYDLGYARFAEKDYNSAARAFAQFTDSPGNLGSPVVADALNRRADAALYAGRYEEAANLYGKAYEKAPASGDYALFQQAVIMGYRRDYNAKIKGLTRLVNEFGTSTLKPDAYLEMSEAYLRLGRNSDAIDTYSRLIEEFPATEQGRQGHVQMAMTLLNTGDNTAAAKAFREVVRRYPTSDEAMVAVEELQRLAAREGNLGEVAAFLSNIENAPQLDIAEADRLSFQVAEEEYINNESVARLERYLNDFPAGAYRPVAIGYLMDEAVAHGLTGDALTYSNLIVTDYPDSRRAEDALAVKATSEHSLGRGAAALASWQALAVKASTPAMQNRARAGIMRVARDMGDYALVIESADALLASSTAGAEDRNEAIFSRGLAHSIAGDNEAARADWSSIAALTDDINGVKSAYYLSQNLFDNENAEAAREQVNAIIDSGTPHTYWLARAFILLSDIFAATDNRFEAREYLRSLRENYPGTENDIFQMIDTRLNSLQ